MDGIFNINKPPGPTSFDIVAQVKRLMAEKRVGHGGTLDPLASGILPVFIGQATRVAEYMLEHRKTYRAGVELGVSTDTYDAEGKVVSRADASGVSIETIETALPGFRGYISQVPPAYSALKHNGQPAYILARKGVTVNLESRPTTVFRLQLLEYRCPLLTLEIECSRGTYIRSIAQDLGQALGCGAYLKSLVRTAYGPFNPGNAVSPEQLQEAQAHGRAGILLFAPGFILSDWPKTTLPLEDIDGLRQGKALSFEAAGDRLAVYDRGGGLAALLQKDHTTGLWQPKKVFREV